jgi:fibronectin-binding autotransporter adhesin
MRPFSKRGPIGPNAQRPSTQRNLKSLQRRRMFLEQLEQRSLLAVLMWDGEAGAQWSNAANWTGDVAPAAGDDLVFPTSAISFTSTNDLPAGTRFNTILLQGNSYSITGNAIELSGGLTANNATGSNTFGLDTTLGNAQSFISANPGTTLNVTGGINTGNIVGAYIGFTAPAIVFDGAGDLNVTGVISGAGGLSKLGSGTVILGGNNTFEGWAEARQGFIRVTHNNGLGSATAGHTEVQQGAAVELSGVTTAENFAIREGGVGFGNGTDISSAGALRAVGGTVSTATGNVELIGGNNLIGASTGSTLNIAGQVMQRISAATGNRLLKVGSGTVQFTGSQPNVYVGDTYVLQGVLELGKTGAGSDKAVPGNLIIGDNIGGDNAAMVRLLASNQLAQLNFFDVVNNTITLGSSGVLNLNGNSDVTGNLVLTTGTTYSADIMTGAGTLTLGGNISVNNFQGSSGVTPAATISGNLDLGSFFSGGASGNGLGAVRTISVADTQLGNIATDLHISATISDASSPGVGIIYVGGGTLRLSGANTFTGPFVHTTGILELGSSSGVGFGPLGTGLFSVTGAFVKSVGGARTVSNPFSIDGTFATLGSDDITFSGPITLTGPRALQIMDPAQTVTFAGPVGEGIFGSQGLDKRGHGTLALTAANTFSGGITVQEDGGTLVLRGAGSAVNASGLTVGINSTLRLDNNAGGNVTDRLNDAAGINLLGRITFVGSSTSNSSEFLGGITTNGAVAHTIEMVNTSAGAFSSVLTSSTLSVGTDRTLNFIGTGVPLSEAGPNRLNFVYNPGSLDDGILPMGLVTGPGGALDFATYGNSAEGVAIIPLPASAYVTDITQATATSNVRLTADVALTTSKSINALLLAPGVDLTGVGATLTVNSSRTIFAGDGSIQVSNLNNGNGAISVVTGTALISSSIFSGAVNKGGVGKLILSGDNQFAGNLVVNEGVLNLQRSSAVGSPQAGTFVRQNATLELEQTTFGPVVVGLEPLELRSNIGYTSAPIATYDSGLGAIRNVSGNNSWAGNISRRADGGAVVNLTGILGGFPVINSPAVFFNVVQDTLTLTGSIADGNSNPEVIKQGNGTLELAGVVGASINNNVRIFDGTLFLNKEPGVSSLTAGSIFIGDDAGGANDDVLRLAGSDQIDDGRPIQVNSSGLFDLNGNSDVTANINLVVGPTSAGNISVGVGGLLTPNGNLQVFTQGTGNPTGSLISGGSLALQVYGVIAGPGQRTYQVNDGAVGNDLTITSAVVDGTGLQPVGIIKTGFGTLELGGTTPNTMSGPSEVREGTLALNKTGGVNALSGQILVGDATVTSGFRRSDVLLLRQPNQLPDFAPAIAINHPTLGNTTYTGVYVASTGLIDLNGFDETIGNADGQTALTINVGEIRTNGGLLTVIGNISTNPAQGSQLWTPISAPTISGRLNLGSVARVIDVGGDRGELPFELDLSANLTGSQGFLLQNSGTLLLSGDNSGLAGDVVRTNGNFAIESDTAFGTGRVLVNAGAMTTHGGKRTIANEIVFGANTFSFISGNNTAGVGAIGGGGNDLEFSGRANVTAGNWFPVVASAGQLTFSGGLGEMFGAVFMRKQGFGTLIFSNAVTLSGNIEIGQDPGNTSGVFNRVNGGTVVLRDLGTLLNSTVLVGAGGTFQLDNSGVALSHRLGDASLIEMSGGNLALVGKSGSAVGEVLGQLRLRNNISTSQVQSLVPATAGSAGTWRFQNYAIETAANGSNVQFVGRGTDITATGTNRLAFTSNPSMFDGIIPTAVLSGAASFDFATVINNTPSTTPYDNFLTALTSGPNFATAIPGASNAALNVKLSANDSVPAGIVINALLLANGGITVSGPGALTLDAGLLASRGVGNVVSVAGLVLAGDSLIYSASGDVEVSSAISGAASSLSKGGTGLVELSGANTYAGAVRVSGGVLQASSNLAFGTTAGNVTMSYGGVVELNNVSIPAEQISLAGFGEFNLAAVGLRTAAGTANTWNGNVVLDHNRSAIEVNSGSSLVLSGVVSSQGLNKVGTGTLQFAGTAANTFAGGGLVIWQGTVEMNKTGANALNTNTTVGDNSGGPNADRLVLLQANQIPDANNVFVTSTGMFDYGVNTDTINAFSIQAGLVASGTITGTGAGTLTINANSSIDAIGTSGAGGSFGPATLAGTLALQIAGGGVATRILTVNDTVSVVDANITATITDGDGNANLQSITKAGAGRLALLGANSFSGQTVVNGGELVVGHDLALGLPGTLVSGSGTIVNTANNNAAANATLILAGGLTIAGEGLRLDSINNNGNNGTGFFGEGALRSESGANTWTGDVTINTDNSANFANVTTFVKSGSLNISGAIGQQNATTTGLGLFKTGPGVLQLSGTTPNTYAGTTSVFEGTLELNKTAGVDAIAGPLTIGNDAGSQNSDVVRLLAADQINNAAQVQVTPSGQLDLGANNESLGNAAQTGLNLFLGITTSPQVTTTTGVLTLLTGVGIQTQLSGGIAAATTSSPGARIIGNLNLGNVAHNINAGDAGLNIRELQIDALINGGGATGTLSTSGSGLAYITGNNVGLTGTTTLNGGGGFVIGNNNAFGSGTINVTANSNLFTSGYGAAAGSSTFTLTNPITQNADLVIRGDQNLTLNGLLSGQGAGNRTLTLNTNSNAAFNLGTAGVSLSNDGTARVFAVNNNTFNHTAATISGPIVNGAGAANHAFQKGGNGWLTLNNNANSYAGTTTVAGGLLQVTANGALGANGSITTNQTIVNNGASLVLAAGLTLPEWLVLNNNGFGNFGSLRMLDAVPGTAETATVSGNVNFNTTAFVGVDGGGANPDRIIFNGVQNSGGGLTTKVGPGEIEFAGAADNVTFTGGPSAFDDGLDIRQGTVIFNKTGTARALLGGAINVGDGGGGNDADRLILAGAGTNQIDDALTVTVGSSGRLTMSGAATTETIANLTLTTGRQASADVDTGTGILTINTSTTVNTFNVTDATAPATVLAGNVVLVAGSVVVNDTFVPATADDLLITANYSYSYPAPSGGFYAGLREGRLAGAFNTASPNTGTNVQLGVRMGQTSNLAIWGSNETWVYSGEVFDADGIFSFAENIDDSVQIIIDGLVRQSNGTWNVPTSTANTANNAAPGANVTNNFGPGVGGWHTIEIRMGNGAGGAGAVAAGTAWTANFGFGFSATGSTGVNGSDDGYIAPVDNGTQNLFRTPVAGAFPVAATVITKTGAGTANIRSSSFPVAALAVNSGVLSLSGPTSLTGIGSTTVTNGAVLQLDNSGTVVANRLADAAPVTLTGGSLVYIGNAAAPSTETIGDVTFNPLNNLTNTISSTTLGNTNALTLNSLTRAAGATVDFVGVGTDLGTASNQLLITGGTTPYTNSVIPYATVTGPAGLDLVTDADGNAGTAPYSIGRVTTYANNINTLNGIVKLDGTEPAANRVLTAGNTVAALLLDGGVTISGAFTLNVGTATAGLIVNRGGNNVVAAATTTAYAGLEELMLVRGTSALDFQGPITGTGTMRKQGAGNLILSANNAALTGAIQVHEGTLTARNSGAFGASGTATNGVTVFSNAYANILTLTTLVLDGNLTIGNEQLDLAGSTALAAGLTVDTVRVINGSTVWGTGATPINLNNNGGNNANYLNVVGANQLTFNGTVGGTGNLVKTGSGTLMYTGTAQNGNAQVVSVNEGTLRLAKTAGTGPIAIRGALTINDVGNFDPLGAATVIYDASAIADQIGDVAITVNGNGTFDLNGKTDSTTGTLSIQGGVYQDTAGGGTFSANALTMTGGTLNTGTGTFNLNGTLTYNAGFGANGTATINGNLNLNGGNRIFTVADNYAVNELIVNATISNGRLQKDGNGGLLLSNPGNTFLTGTTEVNRLVLAGTITAFNITFNGLTQAVASPFGTAEIQAAMDALIGTGNSIVSNPLAGQFDITFAGAYAAFNVANLGVSGVTGGGTVTPSVPTGGIASVVLNGGILTVTSDTALGAANVNVTASARLLAQGGDRVLSNIVQVNPNLTFTLGGRRDFGGTHDLRLAGPLTINASNLGNSYSVEDPQTLAEISGVISGGSLNSINTQIVLNKTGIGKLILSGANTYNGRTDVNVGTLNIRNSSALGASGNVLVRGDLADVALELQDVGGGPINVSRPLFLFLNNGATRIGALNRTGSASTFSGMLRNVAGTNVWSNTVDIRAANAATGASGIVYIGIDSGSLEFVGQVVGTGNAAAVDNNRSIYKTGAGALRYSGATSNTITGTTTVFNGTLELNKSGTALAISGALQIGDNVGADNSDQVVYTGTSTDMIGDVTVTVQSTGVLNLGAISDVYGTGTLNWVIGQNASADVITTTGKVLSTAYNVTVLPGVTSALPATASGILNLGTVAKTFTVNDGPAEVEFQITSQIVQNALSGVTKAGAGRMLLNPTVASNYTGPVVVSGGALRVTGDSTLGDDATGTTVNAGTALELFGSYTEIGEPLTLNGNGITNGAVTHVWNNANQNSLGTGALRSLSGANVWQGNVNINSNPVNIAVDAGSLTFSGTGVLAWGVNGLVKTGLGTLELGGTVANTGTGNTSVQQGTLLLNKAGAVVAIPGGTLLIGDSVGGDNSDLVQYATTAGTNQIGDIPVRIAPTGVLNLNGVSDTINNVINLDVGPVFSADVATGAGVLTNNNAFVVVNQSGATLATAPATFTGIYDLNGATRNVDVREGSAPVEFDIQGVVQVTGAFGINKIGQGRLRLSGSNTYSGTTTISNGVLEVGNNNALGTAAGGTTVANLAALEFKSATPLVIPETNYTIVGDGWNNSGTGAINSISPANVTLAGAIAIPSTSYRFTTTIGNHSAGTQLTLQGNTTLIGNLVVNGDGDTVINGTIVSQPTISAPYFGSIQGRLFMATGLGVNAVTGGAGQGINNLVPGTAPTTTPAIVEPLYGLMHFPQDSDTAFTTFFSGQQPGGSAFTTVFTGSINIPVAGTYYFALTNNDDTAALWLDAGLGGGTAGNNNFEAGEMLQTVACCNGTGFVTVVLPAGTFNFAYAVEDTGGGSGLTGRFQPASMGVPASGTAMPIITTANMGDVTKNDAGTLTLNGQNNYINTIINMGVVLANNATSSLGSGTTTINATGTLGGTGRVTGPVVANSGGIINPGPVGIAPANTGVLTINNDVTFNAGSLLQIDINGTTVGTNYDQLVVGGTGNVTIIGNAVPTQVNTAMVGGTTGNGFQPVNGVDAFKVLNKTSPGPITVGANSFLSQILPLAPQTSPTTVMLGKSYNTSYNTVVGLNDGNDFVLQAVATSRVWDGRIDAGAVNVSNNWTLGTNWVGDSAPFVGDDLVFDDVGISNGKNAPVNDFAAATSFAAITFANTSGTYTVTGNSVTLSSAAGGVTSNNAADVAVSNVLNLALIAATNPQTITVKDGSTLTLGGNISLVAAAPLNVTNGAGADANGSAIFNGTIDGAAVLNVNLIGANSDATFNAAIGGVTPLSSIAVAAVDDLIFGSTIATSGNVTQTSGTGTTTLSGGSIGGVLNVSNEAVILGGTTVTVTGAAILTATAGSISDANAAANNIAAPTLQLFSTAGVATAVDPLETTVGNVEATGGTGGVFLSNNGGLIIGGISLVNGISATGAVEVRSVDSAVAGQDITLPLGASIVSSGSSITLNAGDDALLNGNLSAATTITVNVDSLNADGVGGVATVAGVLSAPGGAFLNGDTNNDTFTVSPQAGAAINVNGNSPIVSPGDVLNLDLSATTNPVLTLAGPGAGSWTFDLPLQTVAYVSIEDVDVGAAFYDLVLDANTSSFGNTNVDDQILLRKSGANFIIERTGSATAPDDDDVGQIFQDTMANILSFSYIGSADNDIVTVSDAGGMPDFVASVPGVTNNPNLAGAAEFLFNGNGGNDTLVFDITGANAAQTYAIGSGTGAAGLAGEIASSSGGVSLLTYFQNVELTQRTGNGATPGGLAIVGDLSVNVLAITANGAFTQTTATGYTPFEFSGNNFNGVSVSGGLGTDTIDLVSYGTGQIAPLATTLNGDGGVDTLRVQSTSGNTGVVTLNGGAGSDFFQLYSATNTVDGIVGQVVVDGTDGNVGGNTDTLTIINSGDLIGDSVLISPVNAGASQDYAVDGITTTVDNDVIFRNIDVLNFTGTQGNDIIDGRFENTVPTHDLSVVTLNGWSGADRFLLFTSDQAGGTGTGVTPSGTASGLAVINLNGDAPGNPNGLDGNDVFGETAPGLMGTGVGNVGLAVPDTVRGIRPSVSTAININGGEPTGPALPTGDSVGDVLNLDLSGLPGSSALVLSTISGIVATTGFQPFSYAQIEDLNLIMNNRLVNLQMGDVFVRGTSGADLIQFMRSPTLADPNHTRARVNSLVVDFTLTGKTLTFAGGSDDYITQANVERPAEVYGEDGNDYISGAMGNDFLVGGLGNDGINGSGGDNILWGDNTPTLPGDPTPQDQAVGGNDFLSGLGGNDVFYGGGGDDQVSAGGGNDYLSGGQGNDYLDGSDGDDRIYGGADNDVLAGSTGNDLLSGGAGNDNLLGGTGNDVLIAGTGADNVNGGTGNDLLISGSVLNESSSFTSLASTSTYSAATYTNPTDNDAALLTLLAQWGTSSDRSSLSGINHDGANDNIIGSTGDDDFCWENADVVDEPPGFNPSDFNAFGMGTDERFGPT